MKLHRAAVTGICLIAATVLVAPAPAGAAPTSSSQPIGSAQVPVFDARQGVSTMVSPTRAAGVIADYWTPERLASAVPAPTPRGTDTSSTPWQAEPGAQRDLAAPAPAKSTGGITPKVAFTHTDGKVFFRDPTDGKNYMCSGGAVNSGKRRLVLTAGHCVHGGGGKQWMQNWVFYPGYQNGAGPAGAFPAYQLWAQSGWFNNTDFHYDYAFAITQNNAAGARVVDRVGGNGLTINPGRPFVTFIGYPWNFAGGEQQAFCQGQLSRRSIFNSDQQLNCNLGGGSSGGSWLRDYSDASGLGYAVSNTSYGLNPDPQGPVYGPYYDGDTSNLYNAAENASP
jgi:V8-like Glu-specific endopeptidase